VIDALTDKLVTTFDEAERTKLYREGLTLARDRVHAVYLHQPFITWAMREGVDAKVRADSAVSLAHVTVN
ncbi:hypothetical protein ACSNOK_35945, partial [Streptomyces sp. URMC 126]|uniref:hypothetical protein n=1 Tax=Streptomyces sp. URMC 126 TaxID=3423401 RepID=UPI003F1A2628